MFFKKTPGLIKMAFPTIIWNCNSDIRLRISFDDGPHPESTPYILRALKKYNLKASFFCLGEQVEKYPELFQCIINDGHLIGSHGYKHLSGWSTSFIEYINNVELAQSLINSKLYRPPYGRITFKQFQKLKKNYKIVFWDVMPGDFRLNYSKYQIVKNIHSNSTNNSIVILHDTPNSLNKVLHVLDQNIF